MTATLASCQEKKPRSHTSVIQRPAPRSVQAALAGSRHVFLAVNHHLDHLRDILEFRQDDLVALDEAVAVVFYARLLRESAHEFLALAQIVARHAGE